MGGYWANTSCCNWEGYWPPPPKKKNNNKKIPTIWNKRQRWKLSQSISNLSVINLQLCQFAPVTDICVNWHLWQISVSIGTCDRYLSICTCDRYLCPFAPVTDICVNLHLWQVSHYVNLHLSQIPMSICTCHRYLCQLAPVTDTYVNLRLWYKSASIFTTQKSKQMKTCVSH